MPGAIPADRCCKKVDLTPRVSGLRNVALRPYDPLGLKMAAYLGSPRPLIPATFKNPGEEQEIYDRFEELLAEKGRGRQAV